MSLTKKERERQSLDAVIDWFAIVATNVVDTEEPDFLLTVDGHVIGAEVTEFYLPSPPNEHLPMQATENEERIIVDMTRRAAIERNVPPQQLDVRLSPHVLSKQNRPRISKFLCDYVAANCAPPGEVKSPEKHELPREIVYIQMYGLQSSQHQWNEPRSGWVDSDFAGGFQGAISKKESLLPTYLKRCQSCWLITSATSDGGSSFIEWSDELAQHTFSANFGRVFFVEGLNESVHELQIARWL